MRSLGSPALTPSEITQLPSIYSRLADLVLIAGAASAGAQLAALPVALGVSATAAGRLAGRRSRLTSAIGMIVAGIGLLGVATGHDTPVRIAALAVAGAGLGAFTPANNAAIMGAAPDGRAGLVSGTLNVTRALGTALGIAVTSILYSAASGAARVAGHVAPGAADRGLALAVGVWAAVAAVTGLALVVARPAGSVPSSR